MVGFKNEELILDSPYKNDIIFSWKTEAEELHEVVASAYALTFVPLFEGFGIPVLEAFACGTPVITSNTTSLPEVAGGAALLCNPYEVESISEAMHKLSCDEELRNFFDF